MARGSKGVGRVWELMAMLLWRVSLGIHHPPALLRCIQIWRLDIRAPESTGENFKRGKWEKSMHFLAFQENNRSKIRRLTKCRQEKFRELFRELLDAGSCKYLDGYDFEYVRVRKYFIICLENHHLSSHYFFIFKFLDFPCLFFLSLTRKFSDSPTFD